ncbi:MAG: iron-sulfur cluster repair di-iron protein, ric [Clostridiaceae bacterium]|jgi:regulator of cell morphogenesis and NO signaling|nr:iron-sulfur cluster repair di-iron protein, ric [Clostridiaceae bacterium]
MSNRPTFNQATKKNCEILKQYVPVVAKVHGGSHPEFHDVRKLFDEINLKIDQAGPHKPDLEEEFAKLRDITSDYTVPVDVCESYEAVYKMLAELDGAYHS